MALFTLVGASAGSLATFILGAIGDAKDVDNNPDLLGSILCIGLLVSYLGCVPFFLLNAEYYARTLKTQRTINDYLKNEIK